MIEKSEIANLTGVFSRGDLNEVQEQMLIALTIRKKRQENELEEMRFEQNLFINNPQLHSEYLKQKQEEELQAGIKWAMPQSAEEARDIEEKVAKALSRERSPEEIAADEEFVRQMTLLSPLNNIDISKLGDE